MSSSSSSSSESSTLRGRRQGRQPLSGRGPVGPGAGPCRTAVLSSPKERGVAAPAADTAYHQKLPRFTVFFAVPIFSHFSEFVAEDGSTWANIGRKMGQHSPKMGQPSPKMGPRWANIAPRWANIALRWAQIALKIGQHSPKMGQHRPT